MNGRPLHLLAALLLLAPALSAASLPPDILHIPKNAPGDRVYLDLPLAAPPAESDSALTFTLACDTPAAVRALTLHLQDGDHWLTAPLPPLATPRQTFTVPRDTFAPDSGSPLWTRVTTLRLSAWLPTPPAPRPATTLTLTDLNFFSPAIAILTSPATFPPADAPLATQSALRAENLLRSAGLPATRLSADPATADLSPYPLLILPYNPTLSPPQLAALETHVKKRGGRLFLFYNASRPLHALLGFEPLPYASQPNGWSAIDFPAPLRDTLPTLPPIFAHLTQNLLPVRADPAATDARTLGQWLTPRGIPDPSLPASAVSPRGAAFSHTPPLATPNAIRWFLTALATSDPDTYSAPLAAYTAAQNERTPQATALLATPPPPPDEMRAVWALPILPATRAKTYARLVDLGFNTLFEQTPIATSPSRLRLAIQAADAAKLRLHAWIYLLNAENLSPLPPPERLLKTANGTPIPWLDPAHPDNLSFLQEKLETIAATGIHGIHLDYVRYPQNTVPPSTDALTPLVTTLTASLRKNHPELILSAAVFPTPPAAAALGQNWPAWIPALDFVAPMLYTPSAPQFAAWLDENIAAVPTPSRILPGIGLCADETQLDPLSAAEQIQATRQKSTRGYALFQLTPDLLQP